MKSGKFILEREHGELLDSLSEASRRQDHFGRLFEDVLKIFRYHLDRELETVLPLLEYMHQRNEENRLHDMLRLQEIWSNLRDEYGNLLNEHKQMFRLIGEIDDYPALEEDHISDLVQELRKHIELEEQVLYPAALMVGELIECSEFR